GGNSMTAIDPKSKQHQPASDVTAPSRIQGRTTVDTEDVGIEALATYPAQGDIYPRPPLDFTGFLDLNTAGYGLPPGLPFTWADTGVHDQISRIGDVAIPFGVAVTEGSKNGYCKLPGAADVILGIALYDMTAGPVVDATGQIAGYPAH